MNNAISPVSTNLIQNYKTAVKNTPEQKQPENSSVNAQTEVMKKDTADAVKTYALVAPKAPSVPENKSFEEYKADLLQQGKIEGKDFTIDEGQTHSGKTAIYLTLNENGRPVKDLKFDTSVDKKGVLESYAETKYPVNSANGMKSVRTMRKADGSFMFRMTEYDNEKSPYKDDIVKANPTADKFKEYLQNNNIEYTPKTEPQDYGVVRQSFTFKEPNTGKDVRYMFFTDPELNGKVLIYKTLFDDKGKEIANIYFDDSSTTFTDFEDNVKY